MPGNNYLRHLGLDVLFGKERTKNILRANPTIPPSREEAQSVVVSVYDFNGNVLEQHDLTDVNHIHRFRNNERTTWINIDGLRKSDVEKVCNDFGIHPLVAEDILSINQRPKMDEVEGILFCLLNMLYYNEKNCSVEQEQISVAMGKDFVISFQEDASRDVFNPIRDKLQIHNSKIRQRSADYLCYALLDMIVDNYFIVMEKLGERIEQLEEEVLKESTTHSLARINQVRKELIVLKRNIAPVRELINGFLRSESDLLEERTIKYYKDIYDHIVQAYDLTENYRDMMMNLQDMYINNVNLKMNEVMKVIAIVTCLMAPATVIGGIFGMNFDRIPFLHNPYGFVIAVGLMLFIPIWMLWGFKRRGWFQNIPRYRNIKD
jgi:magnesium transporter